MKVSELYRQVSQLGFEDSLENEDRFYYATNRALLQVCKIKPVVKSYMLNHRTLENAIATNTFTPIERIEDYCIEGDSVKAYYFECDGNGILYVEKYNSTTDDWDILSQVNLSSNGSFNSYKGFIKEGSEFITGRIRLRLSGDYYYQVRNIALYKQIFSSNETDIPCYGIYSKYDISTLVEDFLDFCCPPILEDNDEVLNQEFKIEGHSILLPSSTKGVYKILYEHRPVFVSSEYACADNNEDIDLPEEICNILPLLVAGYVWIDDEPERSEYYMNLYRERVNEIKTKLINYSPVKIKNVTGW